LDHISDAIETLAVTGHSYIGSSLLSIPRPHHLLPLLLRHWAKPLRHHRDGRNEAWQLEPQSLSLLSLGPFPLDLHRGELTGPDGGVDNPFECCSANPFARCAFYKESLVVHDQHGKMVETCFPQVHWFARLL